MKFFGFRDNKHRKHFIAILLTESLEIKGSGNGSSLDHITGVQFLIKKFIVRPLSKKQAPLKPFGKSFRSLLLTCDVRQLENTRPTE